MTNRRVRPDVLAKTYITAIAVFFFLRVLMIHIIEEDGTGVISTALEIYCIACSLFLWSSEKNVSSMLRSYIVRNKYQNVMRIMKKQLKKSFMTGFVMAMLLLVICVPLSDKLFDNQKAYMSICPLALCIILMSIQGVMRGFVNATGRPAYILNSVVIHCITAIGFSCAMAVIFYDYGLKMNALLKIDDCAPAYGAFGAMLGLACSQAIGLIYIAIIYRIRYSVFRKKIRNSLSVSDGKISNLSGIGALIVTFSIFSIMILIGEKVYLAAALQRADITDISGNWGILYGASLPVVFIFGIICALPFVKEYYVLCSEIAHSDYQSADDHFETLIRRQAVIALPVTAFTAVMAQQLETAFVGTPNDNAINMIVCASPLVLLSAYAIVFTCAMIRMKRYKAIAANMILTFITYLVLLIILTFFAGLGLHAVIGALEAMMIVYVLLNISELGGMLRHKLEISMQAALIIICSGVMGFILFLLSNVLTENIGEILTLVVCAIVGAFVYFMMMIAIHGIDEYELYQLPFGDTIVGIAKKIHIIK